MPISLPEAFPQILAHCQAGREEIGQALERGLGEGITVSVAEPTPLDADRLPADLAGPGLAMAFAGPEGVALLLLAESSGLLPSWYTAPEMSQRSRLTTLVQELGVLTLPDALGAADFEFCAVGSLADAVRQAQPKAGAQWFEFALKGKSYEGAARLIWPLAGSGFSPSVVSPPDGSAAPAAGGAAPPLSSAAAPSPKAAPASQRAPKNSTSELPTYTRSLLHIRVPISVILATKRQPIGQIMELGAGSIIHFEKSCEEMLDLYVGEHRVAKGEAVKVGEKFGLRITSVILPEERFKPVNGR